MPALAPGVQFMLFATTEAQTDDGSLYGDHLCVLVGKVSAWPEPWRRSRHSFAVEEALHRCPVPTHPLDPRYLRRQQLVQHRVP